MKSASSRLRAVILMGSTALLALVVFGCGSPSDDEPEEPAAQESASSESESGETAETEAPAEPPEDTSPEGQLVAAAKAGDEDRVVELLEQGVSPDARDAPRGYGPLHQAAGADAAGVVSVLAEAGADLDAADGIGWTALTWAAWEGADAAARQLLELGADPNAVYPPNRVSPLAQLAGAWRLAQRGAASAPPLLEAERLAIARLLVEAGADPNLEGGSGLPIRNALLLENLEFVRLLVQAGAEYMDLPEIGQYLHRDDELGELLRESAP